MDMARVTFVLPAFSRSVYRVTRADLVTAPQGLRADLARYYEALDRAAYAVERAREEIRLARSATVQEEVLAHSARVRGWNRDGLRALVVAGRLRPVLTRALEVGEQRPSGSP